MISFIIPSYNAQEHLDKVLSALQQQVTEQPFEVIVVDCSEHDQVQQICANYSKVNFIKVAERFNPGVGRNIGVEHAKGECVVFIDSDVMLENNAVEIIAAAYAEGIKAFGGALEQAFDEAFDLAGTTEHYFFNHESQMRRPRSLRSNLSSAMMCWDKATFLSFGGFTAIPRMQDTELTERALKAGAELVFIPELIGWQIQDSPLDKVLRKIHINGINLFNIRYKPHISSGKKWLMILGLPLISLAKATRINLRNLRYNRRPLRTLLMVPVIYWATLYWMFGFYKAALLNQGIGDKR